MVRCKLFLVLLLCCSGVQAGENPVTQSISDVAALFRTASTPELNPAFQYLRFTIDDRVAFLALGENNGEVENWYSADRLVFRLDRGRLVGMSGTPVEWRRVSQPEVPGWREAAQSNGELKWVRVRDVMPGYHIGMRDQMSLVRIDPPRQSKLEGVAADELVWFEERVQGDDLPPARYAVDLSAGHEVVMYGEQCLSDKYCFSWQRWSAKGSAK